MRVDYLILTVLLQNNKPTLMKNVVKPRAECACCFFIYCFMIRDAICCFAVSALALYMNYIQEVHCVSHKQHGVVFEKVFYSQHLYLLPLLEHPLIVKNAACQCQLFD